MKTQYLTLTLLASASLFAADTAGPATPAAAPAAAPAAEAPKAEAAKSRVPGVSEEDYQKFKAARATADKDAKIAALKDAADEAKKKYEANATDPAAKSASTEARKAYNDARKAATLAVNPALTSDVYDKVTAFIVKETADKKKKKAAEAAGADAKK